MRRLTSAIIIGLSCVALTPTGRASAEQKINTVVKREMTILQIGGKTIVARPQHRGGTRFTLVDRGNRPVTVTFNQCHNAAKESCSNGIKSVDHDEETGSCSFSCFAAPSK